MTNSFCQDEHFVNFLLPIVSIIWIPEGVELFHLFALGFPEHFFLLSQNMTILSNATAATIFLLPTTSVSVTISSRPLCQHKPRQSEAAGDHALLET